MAFSFKVSRYFVPLKIDGENKIPQFYIKTKSSIIHVILFVVLNPYDFLFSNLDHRDDGICLSAVGFERIFHRLGATEDDMQRIEVRFAAYLPTEIVLQQISEGRGGEILEDNVGRHRVQAKEKTAENEQEREPVERDGQVVLDREIHA